MEFIKRFFRKSIKCRDDESSAAGIMFDKCILSVYIAFLIA